jgi:hypothetical protein
LQYDSKQKIVAALIKLYPGGSSSPTNNASSLWSCARELRIGDVVIANKGLDKILGIGIVASDYIPPRHPSNPGKGCHHYLQARRINWLISFDPPYQLPSECIPFTVKSIHPARIEIDPGTKRIIAANNYVCRLPLAPTEVRSVTLDDLISASNMAIMKNKIASRYASALANNKNLIIQGPPGTSKTHEASQLAAHLLGLDPEAGNRFKEQKNFPPRQVFRKCRLGQTGSPGYGRWEIVQFHSAYHYEDFVRGIRVSTPVSGGAPTYTTDDGIFLKMCEAAIKDPDIDHVLIIDEINRAPLAGVFGELIYGLEYRGEDVSTPYAIGGNSRIKVPDNLYVIGTMNTADRSIGHIDYAIRRRFAFIPLLPDRNIISQYYTCDPLRDAALQLYDAVAGLFDTNPQGHLSPDFHRDDVQPGHTYFLAGTCDQLFAKFIYQVMPLLREYVKDGVLDSSASMRIGANNYPLDGTLSHEDALNRLPTDIPCDDCEGPDDGGNNEKDLIPSESQDEA